MADDKSSVSDISRNFGISVAFLIPGFIALWPLQYYSPTVRTWLVGATSAGESVGAPSAAGAVLAGIAALAVGMLISAIRWATIDRLLHRTGLKRPQLDYRALREHLNAYEYLIENHYRYYQYYSNSALAVLFLFIGEIVHAPHRVNTVALWGGVLLLLEAVLILAARDALGKHYDKTRQLLGERQVGHSP